MVELLGEGNFAALIGGVGGILLGLAARLGRFCTLGAIEDHVYSSNDTRLRMWGMAIGLSVCATFVLSALGLVAETQTFYLQIEAQPIVSIIGGLIFGYGMAIAGNCGYGALARLGGGDLRNFVIVAVIGVATYATFSGPIAWARLAIFPDRTEAAAPAGIAHVLSGATGIPTSAIGIVIGLAVVAITLSSNDFRRDSKALFWSAVVALAIVTAWVGMTFVNRVGFDDLTIVSHTFAAPIGETILYAMTATGQTLSFGIGSIAGVWVGAFVGSLIKGHFRWEACEDPRELRRQIIGAGLMGVGAALSLGCSFGQGLSAMSVLALSAPLTLAGIYLGARLGLKQLVEGRLAWGL
ncbi:YeeE/YedE family protein [Marivivens niveibacter]|uniref:YeeE/YedE family protein n=1 Tax=Marivivens niveibacter TaxID=1930667 RepID=A0A251X276_9RHOB|nr:YeeE/YedE family protein [Marivivens niveibacter]OUD10488.1 YeeE/YedE family protein [Marivivens niveibacter]